ncbi:hypothetical protein [Mesorhizobium koreense]|nr:hypothetical protein [Mesorhizobium sp. WR6]
MKYLEKRILELKPRKTQITIAAEAGFVNPSGSAILRYGAAKPGP